MPRDGMNKSTHLPLKPTHLAPTRRQAASDIRLRCAMSKETIVVLASLAFWTARSLRTLEFRQHEHLADAGVNSDVNPHVVPSANSGLQEYCQSEFFNVTCPRNSVIVMETANYGRMRAGRCVTGNYGYLGCYVNVLWHFNRRCSGHVQCLIHTMDTALHSKSPCPKDLSTYLEAKYQCITVANASRESCRSNGFIPLFHSSSSSSSSSASSSGYLASIISHEHGFGTRDCPWQIQTTPGKRIRLIVVTFGGLRTSDVEEAKTDSRQVNHVDVCYEVGSVREDLLITPIKVCYGSRTLTSYRNQGSVIYISEGWNVSVYFHVRGTQVLQELNEFVLKYEAVGCAKAHAPPGGWVRLDEDALVIGCNGIRETWHMTCSENGVWVGQIPNCTLTTSDHGLDSKASTIIQEANGFPLGILVVVAIGVSVGVLFGGILLSFVSVYMKRNGRQMRSLALSDIAPPTGACDIYDDRTMTSTTTLPRHVIRCRYHGDVENYPKRPMLQRGGSPTVAESAELQRHLDAQSFDRCDCSCKMSKCEVNKCAPLML